MFLHHMIYIYTTYNQVPVNKNLINKFNGVTKNELRGLHDSHNLFCFLFK